MNPIIELNSMKDCPRLLNKEKRDEIDLIFEMIDKDSRGLIPIGRVAPLLKRTGLDITFSDVYAFMTADFNKKTDQEIVKEMILVPVDSVKRIAVWFSKEEYRRRKVFTALEDMDENNSGYCSTLDALTVLEAACFRNDMNRTVVNQTIMQESVVKYTELDIRTLVRHFNEYD